MTLEFNKSKISTVYARGTYHVIFRTVEYVDANFTDIVLHGNTIKLATGVSTKGYIFAEAPYWLVTRISRDDVWEEYSEDKIRIHLINPSRFTMNLIREGFQKDLSLIPIYETMGELVG